MKTLVLRWEHKNGTPGALEYFMAALERAEMEAGPGWRIVRYCWRNEQTEFHVEFQKQ
jgi:hypothetical protein